MILVLIALQAVVLLVVVKNSTTFQTKNRIYILACYLHLIMFFYIRSQYL